MAGSVAYLLITPECVRRAHTGPILARLLARTGLELAGLRVLRFSKDSSQAFAGLPGHQAPAGLTLPEWRTALGSSLCSEAGDGAPPPALVVVLQGPDAVARVRAGVGDFLASGEAATSLRQSFGMLSRSPEGSLRFCEPGVVSAADGRSTVTALAFLASMTPSGGPDAIPAGSSDERTLVLIKPDNFRRAAARPGNVWDFFSAAGLRLIAARVVHFSVAQALDFYGPVREALKTRLNGPAGAVAARAVAGSELGIPVDEALARQLGEILGPVYGSQRFDNLIRFMTGRTPAECPPSELTVPGTEKTIALVYEGREAVARLRSILGATDYTQAAPGTIRREFGTTLLDNAAHASDSVENAQREMEIVKPFAGGGW